jgi:RNA-splicing ligase RtcB
MTASDRAQSILIGMRHYQGKSCPRGHSGLRYVKGGACVECHAIWAKAQQRARAKIKKKTDAEELRLENRELDKRFDALQKARRDAGQPE